MSRTLLGVCTAIIMSAAMLGAQSQSPDNGAKSSNGKTATAPTGTVTYTGCLSPGSDADSFYLMSAKQKGVKAQATTVKVVPATKKVDLGTFVTQGVEVTGTLDQAGTSAAPAAGSESAPTLTVTKVKFSPTGC
jgi:hypothetical protein